MVAAVVERHFDFAVVLVVEQILVLQLYILVELRKLLLQEKQ